MSFAMNPTGRCLAGLVALAALDAVFVAQAGAAPVQITFWYNHAVSEEPLFDKAIQAFESEHPDIKVNALNDPAGDYYTKLTAALLGGSGPDVFYVRPGTDQTFASQGLAYNIDPLVQADKQALALDQFVPPQVHELQYQGKYWALPYDFSDMGIYYNQDMFTAAGLAKPAKGWTWDDLIAIGKKLTRPAASGKAAQWGFANPSTIVGSQFSEGVFQSYGGELFNAGAMASVADNPGVVRTLTMFADMAHEGEAAPSGNAFFNGTAGMMIDGSWDTIVHRTNDHFHFDVAELPSGDAGKRAVTATGGAWAVAADTQHLQAAWTFVKWLASPEAEQILIVQPTRSLPPRQPLMAAWARNVSGGGAEPQNAYAFAQELLDDGHGISLVSFSFSSDVWRYASQVWSGALSPKAAAAQIQSALAQDLVRTSAK